MMEELETGIERILINGADIIKFSDKMRDRRAWKQPLQPPTTRLTLRLDPPILSNMVNYQRRLDRTFSALVDPTRRAILARLERKSSATVGELAQPFVIKLPAVMKHLDVLADAGLITRTKSGRTVTVRLRPQPMREAMAWLSRYERFWTGSLDRLAAHAEQREAESRSKEA